ncbi:hypothetical protein ES703_53273 [subsurface metagenome]
MSRKVKDKDGCTWTIEFSTGEDMDSIERDVNCAPSTQGCLIFHCPDRGFGYRFCEAKVVKADMLDDKKVFAWIKEFLQLKSGPQVRK